MLKKRIRNAERIRKLVKKVTALTMTGLLGLSAAFPALNLKAAAVQTDVSKVGSEVTQFMDCIEPMPIIEGLSSDCWGAPEVGPRDQGNGLEDRTMSDYCYWDGGIIKDDKTGKYYMFASRWAQASGHWGNDTVPGGWRRSQAIYAVSDNLYGPYEDKGPIWPDWCEGAGHNVFPFAVSESDPLYDEGYRYAISISDTGMHGETANGTIHIAKEPGGPWSLIDNNNGGKLNAVGGSGFSMSNISIMVRPDGRYEATNREGDIAIADSLAGKWNVEENGLWWKISGMPTDCIEDPVIWYSDGLYHIVANKWDARRAYYMTSEDGITNWKLRPGTAYTPDAEFLRYEDGTVNNWKKIERPNIYVEDGKIKAMILAVIDVEKEQDYGNDQHGSKVIVVPFSSEKLTEFATRPDPLEIREGIFPIADTNAQSWGSEEGKNYGGEHYIQMQKDPNYRNNGVLGEGTRPNSSYDNKIGYMKYDISVFENLEPEKIDHAYLSFVYLNQPDGNAKTGQIQATLCDSDWEEGTGRESVNGNWADTGTLTYAHQPALRYDASDIENTTGISEEFDMTDLQKEVKVDVTKLVKQFVAENPEETIMSFATNMTVTGCRLRFGSREAGNAYAPKLAISLKEDPNKPQPVLKVSFDGANANDETAAKNHGTVVGNPEFVEGVKGKAIHFVNPEDRNKVATQYVDFGTPKELQFGTGDFTVMFWYKADGSVQKEGAVISNKDWKSGDNPGFNIGDMREGINLNFNTTTDGRGRAETDRFKAATDNTWHHVSAVIDRSGAKQTRLYIDGNEATGAAGNWGKKNYADISAYTGPVDVMNLVLGAGGDTKYGVGDAYVDELVIYKKALTKTQLQEIISVEKTYQEIGKIGQQLENINAGTRYPQEAINQMQTEISKAETALKTASSEKAADILAALKSAFESFLDGGTAANMSFHLISDMHVESSPASNSYKNLADGLTDMGMVNPDASAFVTVGDNTQDGRPEEFQAFNDILKAHLPVNDDRVMITLGNHDVRGPNSGDWQTTPGNPNAYWETAYDLYMKHNSDYMPETGGKTYYDRWIDGYHFIVLNPEDAPKDTAWLSDAQLEWFEAKLAENAELNKPIFVFVHQALNDSHWRSNVYNGFGPQDAKVKAILAKYPQTVLCSGHIHNGFGAAEVVSRPYGTLVDVPSFNYNQIGKSGAGSAYEVYVYDDEIYFRARDFVAGEWLPEYDISVSLPGLPVTAYNAENLDSSQYTFESWAEARPLIERYAAESSALLNKKYDQSSLSGAGAVLPPSYLYHSDTYKQINAVQKQLAEAILTLEEEGPNVEKPDTAKPLGGKAYYMGETEGIEVSWDKIEFTGITYNVYRKDGEDRDFEKIESGLADAVYQDQSEFAEIADVSYQVTYVLDGKESLPSDNIVVQDISITGKVDNRDQRVVFTGNWGEWTGNPNDHYGGSIHYAETSTSEETVSLVFMGTGIRVLAPRGKNFGITKVFIDGTEVGEADFYGTKQNRQLIYEKTGLAYGKHTIKLEGTGTKNADSSGTKIEFDNFEVINTETTISFTGGQGSSGSDPASITYYSGAFTVLPPCSYKKEGYKFIGWSDGTKTYPSGTSYRIPKENITMEAVWEKITVFKIPSSELLASADSEQNSGGDGPASWAVDGDESTYWHSNYSGNNEPNIPKDINNSITIDLGKTYAVCKLEYVPRKDWNGRIVSYKLRYSTTEDQDDFEDIPGGAGVWADSVDKKEVAFVPISARRIQIRAMGTSGWDVDKYITAAEFYVYYKDDGEAECSCEIGEITFADQAIQLGAAESSRQVDLSAEAELSGACQVAGHPERKITYRYRKVSDTTGTAVLTGDKLSVSEPGELEIEVTAEVPGADPEIKKSKTAVITVTKESLQCTCAIENLTFADQAIKIGAEEESKEVILDASASIGGTCEIEGHRERNIQYTYQIKTDTSNSAVLKDDLLIVKDAGEIQVEVTAAIAGTLVQSVTQAVITVEKEEKPDKPECTCKIDILEFLGQDITLEAKEAAKTVMLSAKASLIGSCEVEGHTDSTIVYQYAIDSDPAKAGTLTGNKLTVNKAGTIVIKVTACVAGDASITKTATASYKVIKKELQRPGKVQNLKAGVKTNKSKSVKLNWNKESNADTYKVQVLEKKKWKTISQTRETSYNVKNLKVGSVYSFRVTAVNSAGDGVPSQTLKTATAPLKPKITAKKSGTRRIKIKLPKKKLTKADGYEIWLKTGKGKFKRLVRVKSKTTAYSTKKLKRNKNYQVKVRSYKKVGKSYVSYSAYSKAVKIRMK